MYLNFLDKKQKELFLDMIYSSLVQDGALGQREQGIVDGFRMETGLADHTFTKVDVLEQISTLKGAGRKVQKAILMEVIGVFSEEKDTAEEHGLVKVMSVEWSIRERDLKKMTRWVQDFEEILQEGYEYILK